MKKHRMKEVSLSEATKLRNGKFKAQSRPSKPWEKVTIEFLPHNYTQKKFQVGQKF